MLALNIVVAESTVYFGRRILVLSVTFFAKPPFDIMPKRIKLERSKGWKMPANTLKVDRTTRWGNPFTQQDYGSVAAAVAEHAKWMRGKALAPEGIKPPSKADIRRELAGHNLACWCPIDGPCHADLLLKIANAK
jgi:hypothetical protein